VRSHEERRREARSVALGILGAVGALLVLYVLVERPPRSCWMGYFLAVVGGIPVTYAWPECLFWLLEKYVHRTSKDIEAGRASSERIWWIAVMVGIFERVLITTLVAHDVSGIASFIAGWVALKMVSGWQQWGRGTQYARAAAFMALLGNAMSILFGLVGGILCKMATTC
jgi:uncharacterized membrane protein YeaQ/YmgE (transglycosylase-associated protein family)